MEQTPSSLKSGAQNWNFQEEFEELDTREYYKILGLKLFFSPEVSPLPYSRGFSLIYIYNTLVSKDFVKK